MTRVDGYTRQLSEGEDVGADLEALRDAGAHEVLVDAPGHARPRLIAWIDQARAGDTLLFVELERVGSTVIDIVRTLVLLHDRDVQWRCLAHPDLHDAGIDAIRALDAAQRRIVANAMSGGTPSGSVRRPPAMGREAARSGATGPR